MTGPGPVTGPGSAAGPGPVTGRPADRPAHLTRTLLAAQLVFNVGFYAVVPFLAVHLRDDLAASATAVAVTLALRTFCQQGLFIVGGALADRWGSAVVILLGVAVRVAGYLGLVFSGGFAVVLLAACITGLGGALFTPALQSLLAATADGTGGSDNEPRRRATVFGRLAVAGEIGAVVGPVLGAALLGLGFRAVAGAGAALFALVGLGLWVAVRPRRGPQGTTAGAPTWPSAARRPGWRRALADRRFVGYSLACGTFLLAYNQLYIAVPVLAGAALEPAAAAALVAGTFVIAAVLIVGGQLPVVALTRRIPDTRLLPAGFVLVAAGFGVVAGSVTVRPAADPTFPVLTLTVLLTSGQLLIGPRSLDLVARFAGPGPTGAYYGLFTTVAGFVTLAGSAPVGRLLDLAPAAAWWLLTAVPLAGAVALAGQLRHRPILAPPAVG